MGIKYNVNENFFKTWSRDSAYVLGFIYADGHLEDAPYIRGKYIRFTSTDHSLVEKIRSAMNSDHKIVVTPASENKKEKYLLRIGSHKLYNDLENLGLHPRKSLDMEFPRVPYRFMSDFVRGYFDGDGCIAIGKAKNRPHNKLSTIFTSGSKNFLISLSRILKNRCLGKAGGVHSSHQSYQLIFHSIDALKVLGFIYNKAEERRLLYLDRKYYKYQNIISSPDIYRCGNLFDRQSRSWN